jgi:hypothetical protein
MIACSNAALFAWVWTSVPEPGFQARSKDAHILRAVGRAWAWRRRLENGEVATLQDIATMEKVSDRFVSRIIRTSGTWRISRPMFSSGS